MFKLFPRVSIVVLAQDCFSNKGEGLTLVEQGGCTDGRFWRPLLSAAIGVLSEQEGLNCAASPDLRKAARENGSRTAGIARAHTAPTHR